MRLLFRRGQEGIKATFHAADSQLAQLDAKHNVLLVVASNSELLTEFSTSDDHKVTFAEQLLAAGNVPAEMAVHDSRVSMLRC